MDEEQKNETLKFAQHHIECAICSNYSRFYCNNCHLKMCEQCEDDHLQQKINTKHEVVLFEERNKELPTTEKCQIHPKKDVDLYCNDCQIPVCSNCFAQKHNKHEVILLEAAYNDCFEVCRQELIKIRNILPQALSRLEKQRESEENIKEEIVKLRLSLKRSAEEIKKTVEIILTEKNAKLSELEDMVLQETEKQKMKLKDYIESLEQLTKEYHNSLSYYKPSGLIAFHKMMTPLPLEEMPEIVKPVLPVFIEGTLLKDEIERIFGGVIMPKPLNEECYSEEKNNVGQSSQPDVKKERTLNIPNPSFHLSSLSPTTFWTSDNWGDLIQSDMEGSILQKISTSIKSARGFHTVTTDGCLIYSDNKTKEIFKVSSDGMISTTWIPTEDWEPRSIHSSHINGDVLVGMQKNKEWKVIKYSQEGTALQEIQKDDKDKNIYKSIHYITENINGDICSSDYDAQKVVVVTKSRRYSYSGHESQSGFYPYGICTDVLGHILVCNGYSTWFKNFSSIHLLEQDCQFLSLILTPDQCPRYPRALCVDGQHNLMVGCEYSSTITVYSYLQNKYT